MITTDRLILREFDLNDAPFIVQILNTPKWIQFIGDRGVKTINDAHHYLLNGPMKSYQTNGFGLMMVALKSDETPIGMCGLIKRDTLEDVDIGFALLPEYEGLGYAFEAASAVMDFGKNEVGLQRIVAITLPENARSVGLLKRIGLTFERMINFPGDGEDLMFFAWEARD
jgi:RimJ/RimL family protein N-acetyltransferase